MLLQPTKTKLFPYTTLFRSKGNLPTAIFAANDPAAIGAIEALNDAGFDVPNDIAIVGAGNIHYGDMLRVPLTTVSWSTRSEEHTSELQSRLQLVCRLLLEKK